MVWQQLGRGNTYKMDLLQLFHALAHFGYVHTTCTECGMSFCCSLKVVVFVVWLYSDVLLYGSSDDHVVAAVVTDNGAATRVKLLSSCCSSQLLLSRTLLTFNFSLL